MAQTGNKTSVDSGNCQRGFTLIEVLIAMVVMSVGLLAIAGMQISSIKANGQASHITRATALIEEKLDGYKSMAYADIDDQNGTRDNFIWTTTVDANTPANDLKTITVAVTWQDSKGPHTISFGTIVSE